MTTQAELGQRLASARLRAGLTQDQVADALGMPRTAVTHVENGHRQVSSLELVRFGKLFGVDIRDLLEGQDPRAELLTLFRSKRDALDADTEKVVEEALPICRMVSDLEDVLQVNDPASISGPVHTYPLKAFPSDAKSQGDSLARLERERLGLGSGPISDLALLAMRNGLIVAEHELPEGVSGIFLHVKSGRSFVLLREDESYGRKRFSLAHEYCHALVDSHELVIVSRYNAPASREWRANAFASAFLLPREGVLQFATEQGLTPENINFTHAAQLAARFEMSYEATVVALDQAHLISAEKKVELQDATRRAVAFMRRKLRFREPQFNRTTLKEWAFQRAMRALELGLISLRKAVSIATQLGYDEDVVRQNLTLVSPEELD
jgi:Zn-dependent peptidase ImmA (M78 family)/transcriptional regulator with XRE-family HTH domain